MVRQIHDLGINLIEGSLLLLIFMKYSHIPESFFHFLWKHKMLLPELKTTKGNTVSIINPGIHNKDAGPDFLCARIRIGDTLWAGNVELHVRSSDWDRHGHQKDEAYGNVIMHVVAHHDKAVTDINGRELQTLCLDGFFDESLLDKYKAISQNLLWVPCEKMISTVDKIVITSKINALAIDRLEAKANIIETSLRECNMDWEECCYRLITKHFGAKINSDPFDTLSKTLPVKTLMNYHQQLFQLEALLFGQSGLLISSLRGSYPRTLRKEYAYLSAKHKLTHMPGYMWNFLRLRPASFPTLRIAQLARLYEKHQVVLQEIIEVEDIHSLIKFFQIHASEYWDDHYIFDRRSKPKKKNFGRQSIELLLINGIIPLLFLYGNHMNKQSLCDRAISFLETLPPENNAVIRRWKENGINAANALESQGLLQLKNERCKNKLCLECSIGFQVLNKS